MVFLPYLTLGYFSGLIHAQVLKSFRSPKISKGADFDASLPRHQPHNYIRSKPHFGFVQFVHLSDLFLETTDKVKQVDYIRLFKTGR